MWIRLDNLRKQSHIFRASCGGTNIVPIIGNDGDIFVNDCIQKTKTADSLIPMDGTP